MANYGPADYFGVKLAAKRRLLFWIAAIPLVVSLALVGYAYLSEPNRILQQTSFLQRMPRIFTNNFMNCVNS
jgi:hypothetical protein